MEVMQNQKAGLKWTGHAIIDMGIASLVVFAEKTAPEEVTFDDLEKFAKYAERVFFTENVSSYLSVLLTRNSGYTNGKMETRKEKTPKLLRLFNSEKTDTPCAFCGKPSAITGYRTYIPMLTCDRMMNFFPNGISGLPICGLCFSAINALTLGSLLCSGKFLVIESNDKELLIGIVAEWNKVIKNYIGLSDASGKKISNPLTRTIEVLTMVENFMRSNTEESMNFGITLYELSNFGNNAFVQIHELPSHICSFIQKAQRAKYCLTWNYIVNLAWQKDKDNNKDRYQLRNSFYEDIFDLPMNSAKFIRKYFLKMPLSYMKDKSALQDSNVLDPRRWDITKLFLEVVIGMEKTRIEAIRFLADSLADFIISEDERLFNKLRVVTKYPEFRMLLLRTNAKALKANKQPIVNFDQFLEIFEEDEETLKGDWKLARDLTLIRIMDQLYNKKWLQSKIEILDEMSNEEEELEQ